MTNVGAADLLIVGERFTGKAAGDFVGASTCRGPVPGGETCSLWIHFAPHAKEESTAMLVLNTNATPATYEVELRGELAAFLRVTRDRQAPTERMAPTGTDGIARRDRSHGSSRGTGTPRTPRPEGRRRRGPHRRDNLLQVGQGQARGRARELHAETRRRVARPGGSRHCQARRSRRRARNRNCEPWWRSHPAASGGPRRTGSRRDDRSRRPAAGGDEERQASRWPHATQAADARRIRAAADARAAAGTKPRRSGVRVRWAMVARTTDIFLVSVLKGGGECTSAPSTHSVAPKSTRRLGPPAAGGRWAGRRASCVPLPQDNRARPEGNRP